MMNTIAPYTPKNSARYEAITSRLIERFIPS
jgi:hypothetical protein